MKIIAQWAQVVIEELQMSLNLRTFGSLDLLSCKLYKPTAACFISAFLLPYHQMWNLQSSQWTMWVLLILKERDKTYWSIVYLKYLNVWDHSFLIDLLCQQVGLWVETEEDSIVALWRSVASGVVTWIFWKLTAQNLSNRSGTSLHLLWFYQQ